MAEPYKHIYKVNLNEPLISRDVGMLAMFNSKANRIGAELYRDGVAVDISGYTVKGYFIRPDEDTVPIDGVVSGNMVHVDLPASCYVYDGSFEFALNIKQGDVELTVLKCYGTVERTRTDATAEGGSVVVNVTNADMLGGKPAEAYTAVQLLDNSWFGGAIIEGVKLGIVNQRGYVSGSKGLNDYVIDRWILQEATTLTFNDGFVRIGGAYALYQKVNTVNAGAYTLAAKMRASGGSRLLTLVAQSSSNGLNARANVQNSGEWVTVVLNFSIAKNATDLIVFPSNNGDGLVSTDVEWISLYPGTYTAETLPPFVPSDPTLELAKCQTFFYPLKQVGSMAIYTGFQISQTDAYITIPNVTMRHAPSIICSDKTKQRLLSVNGTYQVTDIQVYAYQPNTVILHIKHGETATANRICVLRLFEDMYLSADL